MNSLPCLGYLIYSWVRDKAIPRYFKAAVTRSLCRNPITQIRYLQRQLFSVTQVFCFSLLVIWGYDFIYLIEPLHLSTIQRQLLMSSLQGNLYYRSPSTVPIYPLLLFKSCCAINFLQRQDSKVARSTSRAGSSPRLDLKAQAFTDTRSDEPSWIQLIFRRIPRSLRLFIPYEGYFEVAPRAAPAQRKARDHYLYIIDKPIMAR